MFTRIMTELSPWTDIGMFENITGGVFREGYGDRDVTILAVARALLARRLPEGESFRIATEIFRYSDGIENSISRVVMNVNDSATPETLTNTTILAQIHRPEDIDSIFSDIDSYVASSPFEINNISTKFLSQYMKAKVIINKDAGSAIVFTERLNIPRYHLIASVIPTFCPKFFSDGNAVTTEEKEMSLSLTNHGSAQFVSKLAALEDFYDIRTKKIETLIGGFEKREREAQIRSLEESILNTNSQMNDLMNRYQELLDRKNDICLKVNGIKYSMEEETGDDELINFFKANKCIDVVGVSGTRISFIVKTYFDNSDVRVYETYRNNHNFWYGTRESRGVFSNEENRKKILDAVFYGKIKLLICAIYHLDVRGSVRTTSAYDFPPNCSDYIPNYHLDHHECFGDYRRMITEYLSNCDTIGAINACIASAKSVNIAESDATFHPMMTQVFNSSQACFELPDGRHVTPAKALEYIKEQEEG